jgi:hypothetical protein
MRREICKCCRKKWGVSLDLQLPETGYICPKCAFKIREVRRNAKNKNRKKERRSDAKSI